jgi:hypothetical protein
MLQWVTGESGELALRGVPAIVVVRVGGGQVTDVELFEHDDLAAAMARFNELTGPPKGRGGGQAGRGAPTQL